MRYLGNLTDNDILFTIKGRGRVAMIIKNNLNIEVNDYFLFKGKFYVVDWQNGESIQVRNISVDEFCKIPLFASLDQSSSIETKYDLVLQDL